IHVIQIFTCAQVRFYKHRLFYYFDLICLCFFLFLLKSKTFFLSVTSTRQTGSDFDTANRRLLHGRKAVTWTRQTGDFDTAKRRRLQYRKTETLTRKTVDNEKTVKLTIITRKF